MAEDPWIELQKMVKAEKEAPLAAMAIAQLPSEPKWSGDASEESWEWLDSGWVTGVKQGLSGQDVQAHQG